ncbi:MAG: zinc ribbon domain-containing protein [Geoalkalibacter sp.]
MYCAPGWSSHWPGGGWLWPVLAILLLVGIVLWLVPRRSSTKYPPSLHCPACRGSISEVYLRCPHCGETLKRNCSFCSRVVDDAWIYCPFCSQELNNSQGEPPRPEHQIVQKGETT